MFSTLIVLGFVAAWVVMMVVVAAHDRRLKMLEGRIQRMEARWKA